VGSSKRLHFSCGAVILQLMSFNAYFCALLGSSTGVEFESPSLSDGRQVHS
jgi:hypothetical protein